MDPKTETKETAEIISFEEAIKKMTDLITRCMDGCKVTKNRTEKDENQRETIKIRLEGCMGASKIVEEDGKNKEDSFEVCLDLGLKLKTCLNANSDPNLVIANKEANE